MNSMPTIEPEDSFEFARVNFKYCVNLHYGVE